MKNRFKLAACHGGMLVLLMCITVLGCSGGGGGGGGGAPADITGIVTQGPVSGAVVYINVAPGPDTDDRMSSAQAASSTITDANGNFTVVGTDKDDYLLATQGGIDTITGLPAMRMYAGFGARNVTPFTTMVVFNPAAKMAIEAHGIQYDDDVSRKISPAALLVLQSTQSIIAAASEALNPGGDKLTISDLNKIQVTIMTQIANKIASAGTNTTQIIQTLTNTTLLKITFQDALTNALTTIATNQSNISIVNPGQTAQAVVIPIVNAVSQIITAATGTTTFSTTVTVPETSIMTGSAVAQLNMVINTVVANIFSGVQVTASPGSFPVISGSPAVTAIVGAAYRFVPSATDADANQILLFSVINKPAWASFNNATGRLWGTPRTRDAGTTTTGIVISVTDGVRTSSLPAFNLSVSLPTGGTGGTQ